MFTQSFLWSYRKLVVSHTLVNEFPVSLLPSNNINVVFFFFPSGSVLHFSCVHGVVYYLNFLFWKESARNHTDGLLSFKHFPTCYISDVAGQVARHTNNRTKQLFFQPHNGRLCAPTTDNIKLAAKKELKVDLQWVKNLRPPFHYCQRVTECQGQGQVRDTPCTTGFSKKIKNVQRRSLEASTSVPP